MIMFFFRFPRGGLSSSNLMCKNVSKEQIICISLICLNPFSPVNIDQYFSRHWKIPLSILATRAKYAKLNSFLNHPSKFQAFTINNQFSINLIIFCFSVFAKHHHRLTSTLFVCQFSVLKMRQPKTEFCINSNLKNDALLLGKCEIAIGVLNIIFAVVIYIIDFDALIVLPKLIWSIYALLNCEQNGSTFLLSPLFCELQIPIDMDFSEICRCFCFCFFFVSHPFVILHELAVRTSLCKFFSNYFIMVGLTQLRYITKLSHFQEL